MDPSGDSTVCLQGVSTETWISNRFPPDQGSPNFLNKGIVFCSLQFHGAGMWPVGVENAPAARKGCLRIGGQWEAFPIPIFVFSGRNGVSLLVLVERIVPQRPDKGKQRATSGLRATVCLPLH